MTLDNKWLVAGAAVVVLGAAAYLLMPGDEPEAVASATSVGEAARAPAPLPRASDALSPAITALGGSLEETARMFDLGVAGDLRLDMDTKAALDLTLAQLGSNPSAEDIARVENSLRKGLPPAAAQQAIALLHSYRAYSLAYARDTAHAQPPANLAEMRAMLDRQEALQRRHFDPSTAKALFGAQIAHSRYMLEAQVIETNLNLSPTEKAQRIEALRSRLPPDVAAFEGGGLSDAERDMQRQVDALRARGGSEEDVQRVRAQVLGTEGAEAVAQQEQQRAQFERHLQAYLQEKKSLGAPTQAQLDALLAKHFSAEDIPAVRAYERLQTQ